MPQDLRLRLADRVAMIDLDGTAQQVAAVIRRYMRVLGITITGDDITDMTAFLEHLRSDVRTVSERAHFAELEQANKAQIQSTVDAENLF